MCIIEMMFCVFVVYQYNFLKYDELEMDLLNELYDYDFVMYYLVYFFVIDRNRVIIEVF